MSTLETRFRSFSLPIVLLATLGLSACVGNRPYRIESSIDRVGHHWVSYVEFDDQGELWSDDQLYRALGTIREANQSEDGAIVILFVHGWNHNARPGDKHVQGFHAILEQIALEEHTVTGQPRPVIGVYLGWRGRNVRGPLLLPFSFFNRRGAALRIAAGTGTTEVIYSVANAAKENPESKVVLLGHSFGGAILERAVTQAMVGSVLGAGGSGSFFPADAVILLNPASQSISAKSFIETLERARVKLYRHDTRGRRYERPLIVSVTSAVDNATRWLFPLGLGAKGLSQEFRRYDADNCSPIGRQRTFFRRTAGHSKAMLSHTISVAPTGVGEGTSALEGGFGNVSASYDSISKSVFFSFAGDGRTFNIYRRPRAQNDSPYWIIRAPGELIGSHSDIFGINTVRMVGAILGVTGALARGSRTELVRERGMRPAEIVVMPDNTVVVLDRDRRLHQLGHEGEPRARGCVPREVDSADRIGIEFGGDGARVVRNHSGDDRGRWQTEVSSIHLTDAGPVIVESLKINGDRRFELAAVDLVEHRAFLTTREAGEVFVTPIDRKSSEAPVLWADLAELGPMSAIEYDPVYRRLYITDSRSGAVYALEASEDTPVPRLVGADLGVPVAIAVDGARDALYVIDASGGDVLRFECGAGDVCTSPTVFSSAAIIQRPSVVQVSPDGTVWIASEESQRLVAMTPAGGVIRTVDTWPDRGSQN